MNLCFEEEGTKSGNLLVLFIEAFDCFSDTWYTPTYPDNPEI